MRQAALSPLLAFGVTLSIASVCGAQPFPSSGAPNPAMVGASNAREAINRQSANPSPAITPVTPPLPAGIAAKASPVVTAAASPEAPDSPPRAVMIARATAIPHCTVFVDAATSAGGNGTSQRPHKTITAAVGAAAAGAVICVAEGMYPDQLKPVRNTSHSRAAFSAARTSRSATQPGTSARHRAGVDLSSGSKIPARRAISSRRSTGSRSRVTPKPYFAISIILSALTSPTTISTTISVRQRSGAHRRRRLRAQQYFRPNRWKCLQEERLRPRVALAL